MILPFVSQPQQNISQLVTQKKRRTTKSIRIQLYALLCLPTVDAIIPPHFDIRHLHNFAPCPSKFLSLPVSGSLASAR